MEYKVWKTNRFNDEILTELVAIFYDLKKAKDFVEYQSTIAKSAIMENGKELILINERMI